MSWLVSSIANSLKLDDEGDGSATSSDERPRPSASDDQNHDLSASDDDTQQRGVKEDLSELSKTLTRQFWGVASFLAPPPASQISDPDAQTLNRSEKTDQDGSESDSNGVSGFRNDFSEIGGRFRTGISNLSSNKAVSEFTKIASNFLQFRSEENESLEDYAQRGVAGVTEEVVAFARDIAMHPGTWLDFPLPDEDEEDFDLSDAQQEHALAVERLAPKLAALRFELCPGYMSEGCFWKIYFVLVHPRLTRHDAELLSSPQIVKTRSMLTQDLKTPAKSKPDEIKRDTTVSEATNSANEKHLVVPSNDNSESEPINISVIELGSSIEMDKHPVSSTESPVIDKQIVEEVSVTQTNNAKSLSDITKGAEEYDEDGDDWLKEEPSDICGPGGSTIPLEDDEDVSFSDLEEEDEELPVKYKKVVHLSDLSKVAGQTSEMKEPSDWLDIEDIDVA